VIQGRKAVVEIPLNKLKKKRLPSSRLSLNSLEAELNIGITATTAMKTDLSAQPERAKER